MSRSKSRSGSIDLGRKRHASVFSRTISATKFCRGNPLIAQIDENALKPLDKPEQQAGNNNELKAAEEERDRALNELRKMKMVSQEANMKQNEELSSSMMELKMKDKSIDLLKTELKRAKESEVQLAEKDEELKKAKNSEAQTMKSLLECKRRIEDLENEVENEKVSKAKMSETIQSQKKELEKQKKDLEERKREVDSLRRKTEKAEVSATQSREYGDLMKDEVTRLMSELELVKEDKKIALSKTGNLVPEMKSLQIELKSALDAEEKSKKAMDDLAMALKEVATEANHTKEKLISTEAELEQAKLEAEKFKDLVKSTEEKYQKLLDIAAKENERHKNTIERLNLEAEESLLAWADKEKGFVSCIKRAEEERDLAVSAIRNETNTSKEEKVKLRDILKQALNEANVAKEAAGIAREENSQLKDTLGEKIETIEFLIRENESLRVNEAAALESIKELKRLLSEKEVTKTPKSKSGKQVAKTPKSKFEDYSDDERRTPKKFSFNLNELKISNLRSNENDKDTEEYDSFRANPLKGSIFDNVDTPKSEPQTPAHRRFPDTFRIDEETTNSGDVDHMDPAHFSDAENDKNLQRRRKALLWKFGDLIKRKSYYHHHRKDSSGDQKKEPPVDPKKEKETSVE